MHYGETRMEDGLFVAMVMLAQDLTDVERHMKQTISFWKNGPPAAISVDGEEGPGHYGLNRNMEMTVLVGRNKVVSANFPLVQPNVVDAPKILAEVNKFIGGEVPTVPELNMLRLHSSPVAEAGQVFDADLILDLQRQLAHVHGDDGLFHYIVDLAEASRNHPNVALGASPRAALCLLRCARPRALLEGRHYFTHEDVHAVAQGVLAHRLIVRPEAEVEGRRVQDIIQELVRSVPVLLT